MNGLEIYVTLIIDEIYIKRRVENVGGNLIGMADNGVMASTVLSFMINSIHGNYKDIVKLCPVNKLTVQTLSEVFNSVMKQLISIGFKVIAISTDNHVINKKNFTRKFCWGTLKSSVENPFFAKFSFIFW